MEAARRATAAEGQFKLVFSCCDSTRPGAETRVLVTGIAVALHQGIVLTCQT